MKKAGKIINGKHYIENENHFICSDCYRTDVFAKVEEWKDDYYVWPIGRENFPFECWLPLCKDGRNEYEWQRNIDTNNLEAIKVKNEEVALACLDAAIRGLCNTKEDYMNLIKSFES